MARTMELSSNDFFGTPWMPEDSWRSVYSWINSQSNESDCGESSNRSSTSSQPQISPIATADYLDDKDHPLLSDKPRQIAPRTNDIQDNELKLIHELLKLNIGTLATTPSSSSSPSNFNSSSLPSTSNLWRKDEVSRDVRKPLQQLPQATPQWRNPTVEYAQMDMFSQFPTPFHPAFGGPPPPQYPVRRTPEITSQLQNKFEETSEEYRQLEKERKQTEAELARHNLGKKISSSNSYSIPRLPHAPSRTDRLIVDFFRENARIKTLLLKMEQLRCQPLPLEIHDIMSEFLDAITLLQQTRHHERSVIMQQLRGENCYNEEHVNTRMLHALQLVHRAATRARAANWCSLMWTLGIADESQKAQVDRLVSLNYTIAPPPIRPRPVMNC